MDKLRRMRDVVVLVSLVLLCVRPTDTTANIGPSHPISDWFKGRHYFEGLKRSDQYAVNRLGFKAPNIFIMDLTTY